MPEDVLPIGTLKPYKDTQEITPVGKLKPIGKQQGINPNLLIGDFETTTSPDEVLEGVQTNNDSEKELLKNLAIKVNEGKASHEELRDAVLTIQGQHPYQEGHRGYSVMEENGVFKPKPLKKYEPAKNKAISTFSEKSLPQELKDSWDRGLERLSANVLRTPEFLYDLAINENFNKYGDLVNPIIEQANKYAKATGKPEIQFDKIHINTSTEEGNLVGIHNRPAEALEKDLDIKQQEFQQTYDKGITDYWNNGERGKAIALLANSITESAPTTIAIALSGGAGASGTAITLGGGAVFGAGKKTELDKDAPEMDESTKLGISALNGLAEGFFEQWGITRLGGMVKDVFLKEGKEAAKLFTEEAFKKTYAPALGKYLGVTAEEGIGEGATQFTQNAIDKFSGYRPDINLGDGVMDAIITGVGAGGVASLGALKVESAATKGLVKQQEQAKYAFDVAKKGQDAIIAFKTEIDNSPLSPNEKIKAKVLVDTYKLYNDQTEGLDLNDDQKQELFGLSYQKEQLQATIGDDVVEKDLSPPLLAIRNAKQKQAKDLQKQIDEIVLREDVQKQPVTADKTKGDIVKGDEKQSGVKDILSRYGGLKSVKAEGEAVTPTENKGDTKTETKTLPEYKDVTADVWNDPKFNTREKQAILANELDKSETKSAEGTIQQDQSYTDSKGHLVDTFNVTTSDGKTVRFASSMKRRKTDEEKGGYRGNTYEENFDNRDTPIGAKVGMKVVTLKDSKRKVIFVYNNEQGAKRGKHLGMVKESLRGNSNYSQADLDEMAELRTTNMAPPLPGETVTETKPTPKGPADVKIVPSKVVLGQPSRDNFRTKFIEDKIDALQQEGDYNEDFETVYKQRFGEMYDQLNPETKEESKEYRVAKIKRKIEAYNQIGKRDKKKEIGVALLRQIQDEVKGIDYQLGALKKGKLTLLNEKGVKVVEKGKIRSKETRDGEKLRKAHERQALNADPATVEQMVAMDIANGVRFNQGELIAITGINPNEIPLGLTVIDGGVDFEFYKLRMAEQMGLSAEQFPGDETEIADLAAQTVAEYTGDKGFRATAKDNAIRMYERNQNGGMTNEELDEYAKHHEITEEEKDEIVETVINNSEEENQDNINQIENAKTDEEKSDIVARIIDEAKDPEKINPFDDETQEEDEENGDIIPGDPNAPDPFQKSTELQHAEAEFKKAEAELKSSKTALESKRKELDKGLIADQEDLFGERQSVDETALFDERASVDARNEAIVPFKQRYDKAVENYNKAKAKLEEAQNKPDSQQSLFQRKTTEKGAIEKIVNHLKKLMPNVKVEFDENLVDNEGNPAAGKWNPKTKTITINPYYAGTDTAIHEYGHILIDAIGYNNSIVQLAIKQLQGTPLWNEIAELYPITESYTEEMLGKEVLAEAIGREGAGIFDKVSEQSKFKQYLSYIYDWFKSKLGINKNIAKSLAKQIIGGIGTKNLATEGQEAFAKAKTFKATEDKTLSEIIKESMMNFNTFRRERQGFKEAQRKKDVIELKDALADPNLDGEIKNEILALLAEWKKEEKADLREWYQYKEDTEMILSAIGEQDIESMDMDRLIETYNLIMSMPNKNEIPELGLVMQQIAVNLRDKRVNALKNDPKLAGKFNESEIENRDLTFADVRLKVLSHMSQNFPELQELSKMYDSAMFAKEKEAREKKNTLEKLAISVIKEVNKSLGIKERVKSLFSSNSAKYFNYLEKDGKYLTLDEAKKQGLSDAKINFLKYVRELVAEREGLIGDEEIYNSDMGVVKIDKGFVEAYSSDGVAQAFSNYLGNTHNIQNVRIKYTNPNTGKEEISEFSNIEKEIFKYGEKGLVNKAKALALLTKYNTRARRQLKKGANIDQTKDDNKLDVAQSGDFTLDSYGNLRGKFDKKRDKERGFSRDFYKAAMEYIDDTAHVKHISPLMPYINSIEYLNKHGLADESGIKKNVVEWLNDWRNMHIFKKASAGEPVIDATLKALRFLTSATTMWFNIPAGVTNLSIGLYNNWRAENLATIRKGHSRLFGGLNRKISKDYAYGVINPKAIDVLRKYHVVSTDIDSNPKIYAGKLFELIGHGATRYGEFQVQGTQFLGLMNDEDWNSFEYKKNKHGVDELVVKSEIDEKALEERLLSHKNRVSDIQGKYGDKDRRNIQNSELGKATFQFKVWMPDWFKERLGEEYITRDGKVHKGSARSGWDSLWKNAFADLRSQVKDKGIWEALVKGDKEGKLSLEAKAFTSNLKGLMAIGLLLALKYSDDDDEKRRKGGVTADRFLQDLLFVFDPNNDKFIISRPIAAMGAVTKFIDAVDHLFAFEKDDYYKGKSKYGKKGDPKIKGDVIQLLPGRKLIEPLVTEEE